MNPKRNFEISFQNPLHDRQNRLGLLGQVNFILNQIFLCSNLNLYPNIQNQI